MNDLVLATIAFATSTLTAVTGIGGGMILVASMPGLLPAPAIVPVHALVQLVSNSSRVLFGWQFLHPGFILAFIAGGLAGGLLATGLLRQVNLEYTPLMIAAYILYSVWGPKLRFDIPQRLEFLVNVGLDYLTLDRTAPTLSGGEAQRIRLAGQIGCGLVGVLYILDEPSIGLHPRDNHRLLDTLGRLRDMGNTVVVVFEFRGIHAPELPVRSRSGTTHHDPGSDSRR